jgi:bacterioferritin-associated ferredoxin
LVGKQCGQCGEDLRAGLKTERIATYFGQTVLADYLPFPSL